MVSLSLGSIWRSRCPECLPAFVLVAMTWRNGFPLQVAPSYHATALGARFDVVPQFDILMSDLSNQLPCELLPRTELTLWTSCRCTRRRCSFQICIVESALSSSDTVILLRLAPHNIHHCDDRLRLCICM
ncbi:hypothetical protein BDN72DRAFT_132293 [Pluteus cervinus]|uniref:Uncharacterized protein n=1 Tax=Pluteus cervinus TaxID=181527 RepID=A0ACD3AN05_9AGAR|nr:hypothetical protein BDN72DRAFT_132293 [Pluteus cervinus]